MRFQNLRRKHYFEGWYYKMVSPDGKTVLCFIPGVNAAGGTRSCFIQAILAEKTGDDWRQTTDWLDIAEFHAQDEPFILQMDGSRFERDGISVSFQGQRIQAAGDLRFTGLLAPPVSCWAPTVMGPFDYLPGMECIHSVISLSHGIEGALDIGGKRVDFTGGKGYIEKDWGSSFPKRYVWLQSNHFSGDTALFFSWADIPMLGMRFQGYIAHLFYEGKQYRYATYTRGRCELKTTGRAVEITLTNHFSELRIEALQAAGAELRAPHKGRMSHTIKEGLYGSLSFCLKEYGKIALHCEQTETAGIELVMAKGSPDTLRSESVCAHRLEDGIKILDKKIPGHYDVPDWVYVEVPSCL